MYDFCRYENNGAPHKFLTFSFDDGVTQDRRFIEILNRYGIKCTFNLNSGLFGQKAELSSDWFRVDHTKVDAEEVAGLYAGHEVAVHTLTHPRLDKLTRDAVLHEVEGDRVNLERLSGQRVIGMAYPGGPFFNDMVLETILENTPIYYARSTAAHHSFRMPENLMIWNPTSHIPDDVSFDIAKKFIALEPESDALFYVFGHTYEFDIHKWWDELERFCELLAGHDDICYATNGEIADYICRGAKT